MIGTRSRSNGSWMDSSRSRAKWNIIAQQVMMAKVDRRAGPEQAYAMDQWSGYEAARNRVLQFLNDRSTIEPVVITGDIHSNWVADLKLDFADPKSPDGGDGVRRHIDHIGWRRGRYVACG